MSRSVAVRWSSINSYILYTTFTAICCVFVVQHIVQQIHNKSTNWVWAYHGLLSQFAQLMLLGLIELSDVYSLAGAA